MKKNEGGANKKFPFSYFLDQKNFGKNNFDKNWRFFKFLQKLMIFQNLKKKIFFEICTVFYATLTIRFCSLNHSEKWNLKLNRARKIFSNGLVFRKKKFLNGFPFGKFFPNGFPFGKIFFPNSNPFGKIFLARLSSDFIFPNSSVNKT